MKKGIIMTVFIVSSMLLAACSGGNGNAEKDTNESNTDVVSTKSTDSMKEMADKMKGLDYTELDFDVLYADNEFEGEIKNDDGLVESEYYDPFKKVDYRGPTAFNAILPILQDLELKKDMTDEEAISELIKAFDLPEDYLKAELEITFNDGTEKEYELRKDEM